MSGRLHVLVPAAGAGERFRATGSGEVPADPHSFGQAKQLLLIADRPVLDWSCRALLPAQPISMTIALAKGMDSGVRPCLEASLKGTGCSLHLILGGDTRQDSVWLCLRHLIAAGDAHSSDLVLIHDAARPCLAALDLSAVVGAALKEDVDGAVLGRPVTDTLKRRSGEVLGETVDRSDLFRVETPQVFRLAILTEAMERARENDWSATDESTVVERIGGRLCAVEARSENPKLTSPFDQRRIERLLVERS